MRFLPLWLLLPLAAALPAHVEFNRLISETRTSRYEIRTSDTILKPPSPAPRLVMYVQTFTTPDKKPLSLLPLLQHETKVTHVILASIHLLPEPGNITLNDDTFEAPMYNTIWEEMKTLQQNGIKVMALLGGAAVGSYARLNGTDTTVLPLPISTRDISHKQFTAYYTPLLALLKKYNFDGLDIDIEEHVPLSVPLRLLNALYRDMGPSFILTMAPLAATLSDKDGYNLSGFSYSDLEKAALIPNTTTNLISWYNAQFYGGFARSTAFYRSCVDAGWEPRRLVLGVLDSADDGGANGFVNVTTLGQTVRELRGLYEWFGGVAGWEYHDAGMSDGGREPWEWVKRIGEALFMER